MGFPAGSVPTRDNARMNDIATHGSAAEAQRDIVEEFGFFGDWTERYQYLIDLGRKLPAFPETLKREEYKVHGCQSQVWLVPEGDAQCMHFSAISDSAIVSGLIALVLRVYNDRPAAEILATEPDFVQGIGLARHLSPTRSNGLSSMLATLKRHAADALA
jgi:cysteine desulfuration protein SufE